MAEPLKVHLPEPILGRLKARADQAHRTVEAEILEAVAASVELEDRLPDDLEAALASLPLLDTEDLWRAARSHLPGDAVAHLEALHLQRQREGLSKAETETLAGLLREYERSMLVRAEAARLLKHRGHDVAALAAGG